MSNQSATARGRRQKRAALALVFVASLVGGVAAPMALAGFASTACAFADSETATECVISDPWTQGGGGVAANQFSGNGPFVFHKTLHITGTGSITSPVVGITLTIDGTLTGGMPSDPNYANATGGPGHLLMDRNAAVLQASDTTDLNDQSGGPIVITTSGNVIMQAGSKILSTNAGDGHSGNVTIDVNGDKMVMCGPAGAIDAACGGAAVLGIGTLNAATNATQITITVNETVTPQPVQFYIQVDNEQMLVTARSGAANPRTYSVQRGVNGTTATSHSAGAAVSLTGATIDTSTFKAGTVAGNITIDVGDFPNNPTGTFLMESGTYVTANGGYQAGVIKITAGKSATINGNVLSQVNSGLTGAGNSATAGYDGRDITIQTGCGLDVGGKISSFGQDQGADLVHLESCLVTVRGGAIVESSGSGNTPGHQQPGTNNPNHCNGTYRPDHDVASACVEIWAKVIDIQEGGIVRTAPIGNGWIDLFATEVVKVAGGTGAAPFAVNASGGSGWVVAGEITVKVKNGPFKGTGNTLQATALGEGGDIVVEAEGTNTPCCSTELTGITLGTSEVEARGSGTSDGDGGTIHLLAYHNAISGENPGVLDLNKFGGGIYGTATLEACIDPATTYTGAVIGNRIDIIRAQCAGAPTFADYVVFNRNGIWDECGELKLTGLKFNDLDGNHQNNGEPGLGGWVIHITGPNTFDTTVQTQNDGSWSLIIPGPGTYTVCEVLQADWTQTYPQAGQGTTGCAQGEGPVGYLVTVSADDSCCDTGVTVGGLDFGNFFVEEIREFCEKEPVQTVLDTATGQYPGNAGPDVVVRVDLGQSVQDAVDNTGDANSDGYIIIGVSAHADGSLGGSANQKVAVWKDYGNDLPFALIGCSVTLTGGGSDPSVWVKSSANAKNITVNGRTTDIFVMDLHGGSSAVGVQADGQYRYLRNEYGVNSAVGIKVLGNDNTVHNGKAEANTGDGVYVQGNGNLLTDTDSFSNGGNGFNVAGNSNQLLKLDAGDKGKGNGADAVHVVGNSNTISENDAFASGGDGIDVAGNSNVLKKNVAGDKGKGNAGSGIRVAGASNNLDSNKASANGGDGFVISGALTSATSNLLKNNQSNAGTENTGAEFRFTNWIKNNGGGNKADGVQLPNAAKMPAGFPASGATKNFAAPTAAE